MLPLLSHVRIVRTLPALALAASLSSVGTAAFVTYTSLDQWTSATSGVTTINFSEFPTGTLVSTQYSPLGVTFVPGDDIIFADLGLFASDGVGLGGGGQGVGPIEMEFSTPITSIGVRFPTIFKYELYSGQELIAVSQFTATNGGWSFAGIVSEIPFDRAILRNEFGGATVIDTLFFGGAIPGPGGLAVLGAGAALSGLTGGRRRKNEKLPR